LALSVVVLTVYVSSSNVGKVRLVFSVCGSTLVTISKRKLSLQMAEKQ
jgi:hypothetical protein